MNNHGLNTRMNRRSLVRQRGIALVELAVMTPVLMLMLVMPLYLGRVYWHYTVVQHAAQNAARFLSRVPPSEIQHLTRGRLMAAVAKAIADDELTELAPGADVPTVEVHCDTSACLGYDTPLTVRVQVDVLMVDVFFNSETPVTLRLKADVTAPYVGR